MASDHTKLDIIGKKPYDLCMKTNETGQPPAPENQVADEEERMGIDYSESLPADIADATAKLAAALVDGDYDRQIVQRQAQLLDTLLYTIMNKGIDGKKNPEHWIPLALQVQKQCIDTLKARASIDYMDALFPYHRRSTPPTPLPENDERTDEA